MAPTKKVLVTGGSGLVGQGLRAILKDPKYADADEEWVFLGSKDGDLASMADTVAIFEKHRPTHVIHLAARVGGLFRNLREGVEMFRLNTLINDNVLACCHRFQVAKAVSCLSTCIFPDKTTYPIDESMLHDGPPHYSNEGYAYAKRSIDILNRAYNKQYGCKFTSVVPCNIYGPHDNYNLDDSHVLPGMMHRCKLAKENNEDFVMWGSGKPLRQFIYSLDLAALFVLVLRHYDDPSPIILSVGEDDEVSIRRVAELVADCMGMGSRLKCDLTKSDGQFKKTANNGKLMAFLKEKGIEFTFTPIEVAVKASVEWFLNNYDTCRK